MTQTVHRCAWCHTPIGDDALRVGAELYHRDCARARASEAATARCWYDHRKLAGHYQLDAWGSPYCSRHDGWPSCVYCRRLIDPAKLAGNPASIRPRCDACGRAAVSDNRDASARIAPLWQWLRTQGLTLAHTANVEAALVNEGDLHLKEHGDGLTLGVTSTVDIMPGLYAATVRILTGMPSPMFESTVIHELGHVWLRLIGVPPDALAKPDEEGFCDYLAIHWLRDLAATARDPQRAAWAAWYAQRRAENDHPVYGGGYRRVQALADKVGVPVILASLRATHTLPA